MQFVLCPAAAINGISCLGVVEFATVMPLRRTRSQGAREARLRGRAESCEVDKEHSFARGFTLRLVGTFANDGDALRVAAGPLRRTHWFVAVLIKLIADTFVCERPRECAAERRF